ncbi:MAG TPA: DNA-binding domain-containing protein [Kofleriaceae bacterium]|nr:DNA-binding domain-containing protein [Kofleriaceae bacterium]
MRLADLQRQFQAAILDPSVPGPSTLRSVDGVAGIALTIPKHARVHRSHFWTRMTEFITNWQPLLARLLGAEEMDQLVRRYIAAHPPRTVVAAGVCAQLADFVRTAEPWSAWPIIGELAAIDYRRVLLRACAEEATVTGTMLAAIDPVVLASIRFRLKQRAALMTSRFRLDGSRVHLLARETPLDLRPVHQLVHLTGRRYATLELDPRSSRAFEPLVEGVTLPALDDHLTSLGFDDRERRRFVDHVVDGDLLVAIQG